MGAQMIVMSLAGMTMMGLVNRQGVDTAAAYGVSQQLWNYIQMPAMAIGAAVSAMAAQNIGAGRWDRVSSITRSGLLFNLVLTGTMVAAGDPVRPPGDGAVPWRSTVRHCRSPAISS